MMESAARKYQWEKEERQLAVTIPWDRITARSFVLSLLANAVVIALMTMVLDVTPELREPRYKVIPIRLIEFGLGEQHGRSGGNLTREGSKRRGPESKNPLQDAEQAPRLRVVEPPNSRQYHAGDHPIAVKQFAAVQPDANATTEAQGKRDVGKPEGEDEGIGLGMFGDGAGQGYGYNLQWGSGGNRIVLYKELPQYPAGVRTSAQIRLRFTVRPDGSVDNVVPLQKGDPALEQVAMRALRRWKFNPLDSNVTMVGIITFTFTLE